MDEQAYEQERNRLEGELRPKLTREFLDTLADAGRTAGWTCDYVEVIEFVKWCFEVAGQQAPNMEPFLQP